MPITKDAITQDALIGHNTTPSVTSALQGLRPRSIISAFSNIIFEVQCSELRNRIGMKCYQYKPLETCGVSTRFVEINILGV
jgi:hypothetical protein